MRRACAWALLLALLGCAALPWPQRRIDALRLETPEGWLDLRGVVHVHTEDSHDSPASLDDALRAARDSGVHWIALSEHTNLKGRAPKEGRFDGVIVIPGFEMRAFGGSILGIGLRALPPSYRSPMVAVREIHQAGGLAIVSHFETSEVTAEQWAEAGLDGLEIANLHAAAEQAGLGRVALRGLTLPWPATRSVLQRTPHANLERWRGLPEADLVVGGSDAHANVRVFGPLGGTVNSYRRLFPLLTTHVLVREATQADILESLRAGRSYVAYEGRGRVDRFRFARSGALFEIEAPGPARLVLVCDGARVAQVDASRARLAFPPGSRRCRGEAWLGDDLWIVTSYHRL